MLPTSPSQTAIFWDFENCRPSSNISGNKVVYNIRRLVQGYGSITTFRAYIDLSVDCAYSRSISFHSDLQSSGLSLVHCPHNGKKDVADKMMIVDMLAFAIDRPAPACIVLITGDRDFAYAAAILKLRGYRIIAISPASNAHTSLKVQADELYDWQTDILDSMDSVVDTGNTISKTFAASASEPSGPLVSAAPSSSVCQMDIYPNATARIAALRSEVLPTSRPQSEFNSLQSSSRNSLRPSPCLKPHVYLSPSLSSRYDREAGIDFGSHCSETSTCRRDIIALNESSRSANNKAVSEEVTKNSVTPETAGEPHPSFQFSSHVLGSPETSTEFETASWISEIESDVSTSEPSLIVKSTTLSSHEAISSNNALRNDATSSAPSSTHIRVEALQDASTGHLDPCQVEKGDIVADSIGFPCKFSDLASIDESRGHFSSISLSKESGGIALPTVDQPCSSFESALKTGQTGSSCNSPAQSDASIQNALLPTREDQQRFQALISFFIGRRTTDKSTRAISSEVAVQLRKKNPRVYQMAGVKKLKSYIEAARQAGVIIGPGLNSDGTGWVEMNPVLYRPVQEDTQSTKSAASPATPSKQSSSSQASQPAAEWIYAPLTSRLRAEIPSHRLLYSILGTFFRAQHPDLYKRANVSGLSAYLEKAERNGIIRIGSGGSPGSEWAELMPAYRVIVHGSNS
ncbi:hypothetical protein ACEPAI_5208 [Sanghuangporus weigelae]